MVNNKAYVDTAFFNSKRCNGW